VQDNLILLSCNIARNLVNKFDCMLYLVPTPIGNLSDITLRALEVLNEADLILAEDTRQTGKLLRHYNIENQLRSYHSHNEHREVNHIIEMLKSGQSIALVSDAGSPAISDPGFLITRACHRENIKVVALPGATAFVPALIASGLACNRFYFEGFLPQKKGRHTRWLYLKELRDTIVLYESPYRVLKCLSEIELHMGDERMVCTAREISKVYEEVKTLPINKLLEYHQTKDKIRGEFVIIIGKSDKADYQ